MDSKLSLLLVLVAICQSNAMSFLQKIDVGNESNSFFETTRQVVSCQTLLDCPAYAPVCNTATKTCVRCLENSDCINTHLPICTTYNDCVQCLADSDCPTGTKCYPDTKQCSTCPYDVCKWTGTCDRYTGGCALKCSGITCIMPLICEPYTGVCYLPDWCAQVTCGPTSFCDVNSGGQCVEKCANVTCNMPAICEPYTGTCYVPDWCATVTCGPTSVCDPMTGGTCVEKCANVTCNMPSICEPYTGTCYVPDWCANVTCGPTSVCDPVSGGTCIEKCSKVTCVAPSVCDPYTGTCLVPDVDECALPNPCGTDDLNATCTNTVGNYTCNCSPGFTLEANKCMKIPPSDQAACKNADKSDGNPCNNGGDTGATCIATCSTTYTCKCSKGFWSKGNTCVDANECESQVNPCPDIGCGRKNDTICRNKPGSSSCSCGNGAVCPCGTPALCVEKTDRLKKCKCGKDVYYYY